MDFRTTGARSLPKRALPPVPRSTGLRCERSAHNERDTKSCEGKKMQRNEKQGRHSRYPQADGQGENAQANYQGPFARSVTFHAHTPIGAAPES